jgi:hypothetical protein
MESDEPVPLEIDGDAGGFLPAEYSVLPSAATFIRPSSWTVPAL